MLLKNSPIYLAYIFFPLTMIFSRYLGFEVSRIVIDFGWFACLIFSIFAIICKGKIKNLHIRNEQIAILAVFSVLLIGLIKFLFGLIFESTALVPLIMSMKPVFYLIVFLSWAFLFRTPSVNAFVVSGAILSLLVISEMILVSLYSSLLSRPKGSGEINYDACLILISLLLTDRFQHRFKPVVLSILIVGLLCTFSRTAIAASGLILLLSVKGYHFVKLVGLFVGSTFIVLSFQIRGLSMSSFEHMDRYWMWLSGLELYFDNVFSIIMGFNWGVALNAEVPDSLVWLWSKQAEGWGVSGIYSFNYHAFWLRVLIDWGILGVFLLFICLYKFIVGKTVAQKGLAVFLIIQGATMGLFYLSNVAIPLMFAIFLSGWFGNKDLDDNFIIRNNFVKT